MCVTLLRRNHTLVGALTRADGIWIWYNFYVHVSVFVQVRTTVTQAADAGLGGGIETSHEKPSVLPYSLLVSCPMPYSISYSFPRGHTPIATTQPSRGGGLMTAVMPQGRTWQSGFQELILLSSKPVGRDINHTGDQQVLGQNSNTRLYRVQGPSEVSSIPRSPNGGWSIRALLSALPHCWDDPRSLAFVKQDNV